MTNRAEEFNNGIGQKILFHGTSQEFKPGDIIYPATHPNHPDSKENIEWRNDEVEDGVKEGLEDYALWYGISRHFDHAWASGSIDNAKGYAIRNSRRTSPHTYQVVHLDSSECEGCLFGKANSDHTDPQGFRVVREI